MKGEHRSARLGGVEITALVWALLIVLAVLAFAVLADAVRGGGTGRFDERFLVALRAPGEPTRPVGPAWLPQAARDITSLGSAPVLTLLTAAVVAGFGLLRRRAAAGAVLVAVVGGAFLDRLLKVLFHRPRPTVVPHLDLVDAFSFPSGHAMLSAVVYLTLAGLVAGLLRERRLKVFVLATALTVTALVGATRVYLGVHYPTDVLAGWAAGLAWSTLWVLAARRLTAPSGSRVGG